LSDYCIKCLTVGKLHYTMLLLSLAKYLELIVIQLVGEESLYTYDIVT